MALKGKAKTDYQKGYMEKRRAGLTEYHPILEALIDPKRRKGLQFIYDWLKNRGLLDTTYYGCGWQAIDFKKVGELLETTQGGK